MSTVKALLIPVDEPARLVDVEDSPGALQELVGGWLEHVPMPGGGYGLCDEDANHKHPPPPINRPASLLGSMAGLAQMLRGPVVVIGVGDEGAAADAPDPLLDIARDHGVLP
jgi:Domain of unknown function (DUF3846)